MITKDKPVTIKVAIFYGNRLENQVGESVPFSYQRYDNAAVLRTSSRIFCQQHFSKRLLVMTQFDLREKLLLSNTSPPGGQTWIYLLGDGGRFPFSRFFLQEDGRLFIRRADARVESFVRRLANIWRCGVINHLTQRFRPIAKSAG